MRKHVVIFLSLFSLFAIGGIVKSIVGGGNIIRASNGSLSAKSYIQDGLIAMWDGIENIGWGQHDSSATIWKDLVGHMDLTVSSSACFSQGAITRSTSATDFGPLASRNDSIVEARTLEACYASLQNGDGGIVFSIGLDQRGLGQYINTAQGFSLVCRNKSQATLAPIMFMKTIPITSACTWENETTAQHLYYNGVEVIQETQSEPNWGSSAWSSIKILGRGVYDTQSYKIGCCFRVYNRPLSAEEVAYNYSIDKARFGLP